MNLKIPDNNHPSAATFTKIHYIYKLTSYKSNLNQRFILRLFLGY